MPEEEIHGGTVLGAVRVAATSWRREGQHEVVRVSLLRREDASLDAPLAKATKLLRQT